MASVFGSGSATAPIMLETPRLTLALALPEAAPRMVAYRRDNWDFHAPWSGPRGQDR